MVKFGLFPTKNALQWERERERESKGKGKGNGNGNGDGDGRRSVDSNGFNLCKRNNCGLGSPSFLY